MNETYNPMSREEALHLLDVLEDSHTTDEEKRLAIARLSELICILLPE